MNILELIDAHIEEEFSQTRAMVKRTLVLIVFMVLCLWMLAGYALERAEEIVMREVAELGAR